MENLDFFILTSIVAVLFFAFCYTLLKAIRNADKNENK
jgi:hypothetical protein